jgi:hypothetical protein
MAGFEILNLIREMIEPESWDTPPNSMQWMRGKLIVRNAPAVHQKIALFLRNLSEVWSRVISIEAYVLNVDSARLKALTGGKVLLDGQRMRSLLQMASQGEGGNLLQVCRLTATQGRRVHVLKTKQKSYIADYDTEVAQGTAIAYPIMGTADQGTCLDVRPVLSHDGGHVHLEVRFWMNELTDPMKLFQTMAHYGGSIHLTSFRTRAVHSNLVLPRGTGILLGESFAEHFRSDREPKGSTRVSCILLKPEWRVTKKSEVDPKARGSQLEVIDPRMVVTPIPEFEVSSVRKLGWEEVAGSSPPAFPKGKRHPWGVMDTGDLTDWIRETIRPDTWDTGEASMSTLGKLLFVRHNPEVLQKVKTAFAGFERDLRRSVTVKVHFFAATNAFLTGDDWQRGGMDATGVKKILTLAEKGETIRRIGLAAVTGMDRQEVCISDRKRFSYVWSYDVDVAQEAAVADPCIRTFEEGVNLIVRPATDDLSRSVVLHIAPTLAWASPERMEVVDTEAEGLGKIHIPVVESQELETTVRIPDGGGIFLGSATRGEDAPKGFPHVMVLVTAKAVR